MKRFRFGLVVGKFSPLHKGHEALIQVALESCDDLGIMSYSNPGMGGCSTSMREGWIRQLFPKASVLVLPPEVCPLNDAPEDLHRQFVAEHCNDTFGRQPDAVFANEAYGPGFAQHLSRVFGKQVTFVSTDLGRRNIPVSGTMIREDVHLHWKLLPPIVYADFVETVCLLGGESTGKSTLARRAADLFKTTWVDEYGRTLWEEKDGSLEFDDLLLIARNHILHEERQKLKAKRFLFVDTSPLTTLFYSQELFERVDPELLALSKRKYTHTFLCEADFPFVQDGTRRDETFRQKQQLWYRDMLQRSQIDFHSLCGSIDDRLRSMDRILMNPASMRACLSHHSYGFYRGL